MIVTGADPRRLDASPVAPVLVPTTSRSASNAPVSTGEPHGYTTVSYAEFYSLGPLLRPLRELARYYASKLSFPSQIVLETGLSPLQWLVCVMSSEASLGGDSERDPLTDVPAECYDVLRHPRRIRVLAVLGTHRTRLSLADLTTEIVDRESPDVPTGQARHEVRISLVHNHLPRLAEYDLVEYDTETGVELVDEPPVHPADLEGLLALCDGEDGERMLDALVHPVRMRLVSMLTGPDRTVSVERLASKLADSPVGPDARDRAKISLHHAHLPMLADVGAVAFDPDAGLVTRREQPTSVLN